MSSAAVVIGALRVKENPDEDGNTCKTWFQIKRNQYSVSSYNPVRFHFHIFYLFI